MFSYLFQICLSSNISQAQNPYFYHLQLIIDPNLEDGCSKKHSCHSHKDLFSILDVYIKFLSPHHSPFLTKPAPWKAPQACEVEPETDGSTAGPLEDSQAESFEGFHVEPNEGGEEWAGDGGEEWGGDGGEEEGTWGDGQPMMYPSESHPSVEGDADGSLVAGESEQPHLEAVSHFDGLSDDDVEFISATAATSNAAEDIGEDQQKIQEELQRLQNLLVEAESLEAELETLRPIVSEKM